MNITEYLIDGGGDDQMITYARGQPVEKDSTMRELIPETVSECALFLGKKEGEHCISDSTISRIGDVLGVTGDSDKIISSAMETTKCESERCILSKMGPQLGATITKKELINFKINGPTDNKLLTNINLDATLLQWREKYPDFYPYNFNMRNYASHSFANGQVINRPDTLATINFDDLYNGLIGGRKYTCCGCIINTDVYQGDGKHWMALFADARPGAAEWAVEFFNSSGNPPSPEWINWLEKTRNIMERIGKNKKVSIVKVTAIRHQQSKSECGVYSLFYIWARLHGVDARYFTSNPVPDQLMFEFRQHLFNDPSRKMVKVFRWDEYKNTVSIEWEN